MEIENEVTISTHNGGQVAYRGAAAPSAPYQFYPV